MDFATQVSRVLDAEHRATLGLLGRVDAAFGRAACAAQDPAVAPLARELRDLIGEHVDRHFGFEERLLFPRLAAAGESGVGELLHEDHVAILAVAAEILPLAAAAALGPLDAARFARLKRGALDLSGRLAAHIHKETMALLPALDGALDANDDAELALAYASG
jgi:hemerythrin-like domain-containing protein